ncbi:uncharacterized protein LOC129774941 [Toxorhynchites rutilus septentrionalis]|uniref:uncharacterized protein LOC129774941 n=1 Tax=Toxorhynchites rutilus septentrionalis TaxID=329112 RepID=UPI00247A65C3|nr:uncharacterized protein LOC129774941 [Toxorhynchites rutilus septentrionalis]
MLGISAVCVTLVVVGVVLAEPPVFGGYPNRRNGGGGGHGGIGATSGGYQQVSVGAQTSEGQNVDPQLLQSIKTLLLQHESTSSSQNAHSGGAAPQDSYGPPAGSSSHGRVIGIELAEPKQSIQVAEYWQGGAEQASSGVSDSYGTPVGY